MRRFAARVVRRPRPSTLAPLAAVLLTVLGLPAGPASAVWVHLSSGLPFSDISYRYGSTPRWAVFGHDAVVDGAFELWSVPSFGGTQQRISGLLPSGSATTAFAVDSSGARVVYIGPFDTLGVDELYSVPIGGGLPVKLNPGLPANRDVTSFQISPDGQRVVYLADQDTFTIKELFSVPIGGGAAVKISGPLAFTVSVVDYEISRDNQHVVFGTALEMGGNVDVRSVPMGGGVVTRLNSGPPDRRAYKPESAISPDSQRVVYWADQDTAGSFELYSVPVAGGASVKLNNPLVAGQDIPAIQISSDSQRVAFLVSEAPLLRNLWASAMTGGGATKLNGALVSGGSVDAGFLFSPDSQRVVYMADQQTDEVHELYSSAPTGGGAVKLNGALVSGGDVFDFQFSPSSQWVVYRADQTLDALPIGVRVPVAGPAASGQTVWQGPIAQTPFDSKIDPDGQSIVVRGGLAFVDSISRLWRFPIEGTLNPGGSELVPVAAFQANGDVASFSIGADGAILYVADQLTDEVYELFTVPMAIFWDGFESGTTTAWTGAVP